MCEIFMGLNAYIREEGLINTSPVVIMPHERNQWLRSQYDTKFLTVILPPYDFFDLGLIVYKPMTDEAYDGRAYDPLLDPPDEPPKFARRYFMPANQLFDQWGQPLDDPGFGELEKKATGRYEKDEPLFGFFHGQPYANHWLQPPVAPGYENPIHRLYMNRLGFEIAIPGVNIPSEAELRRRQQTLEALRLDMLSNLGIPQDREPGEQ